MRNPSASTKPSLNATSDLPDERQDLFPEQFERLQHGAGIAGAGILQRQVEHPSPDLIATASDLFDNTIRTAAEADRQHAADIRRPLLARNIASVRLQQRITQPAADWERRLLVAPIEQLLSRIVGLAQDHVGAVDDVVRTRLPAVVFVSLAIVAGGLRHQFESAIRHAETDVMARGEFTRLRAGADSIGRWMSVLRARPDRHGAILIMPSLPTERLRFAPRLEDQLHPLIGALARFLRVEVV